VFRAPGEDTPLPYGLPEDPQEPFTAIVAPNIDKISAGAFTAGAFTPGTPAGRRTRRGLLIVASSVGGSLLLIGLIVGAQSVMALFGAE
jgi:hypothetical protein